MSPSCSTSPLQDTVGRARRPGTRLPRRKKPSPPLRRHSPRPPRPVFRLALSDRGLSAPIGQVNARRGWPGVAVPAVPPEVERRESLRARVRWSDVHGGRTYPRAARASFRTRNPGDRQHNTPGKGTRERRSAVSRRLGRPHRTRPHAQSGAERDDVVQCEHTAQQQGL